MTVYELIQELAKYPPDSTVRVEEVRADVLRKDGYPPNWIADVDEVYLSNQGPGVAISIGEWSKRRGG